MKRGAKARRHRQRQPIEGSVQFHADRDATLLSWNVSRIVSSASGHWAARISRSKSLVSGQELCHYVGMAKKPAKKPAKKEVETKEVSSSPSFADAVTCTACEYTARVVDAASGVGNFPLLVLIPQLRNQTVRLEARLAYQGWARGAPETRVHVPS